MVKPRSLRETVLELVQQHPGCTVAIAWRDLAQGRFLYVNAHRAFHAASTVKLGLMIEAYRRVARGMLSLDTLVPLSNSFESAADGSVYALSPKDDADAALYDRLGQSVSIGELVRSAVCVSGNLAANILLQQFGPQAVNRTFRRIGAADVVLRRGFMDLRAYDAGINNTATARGLVAVLAALARGRAVNPEADREMVHLMMEQMHRDAIPALLPDEAGVANKTGWFQGIHHDAALVYPPGRLPYALVILTSGFPERIQSARFMAQVSAMVYAHVVHTAGGVPDQREI